MTACLLTLAAAFAWGYLAHRDQIFPYDLAKGLAIHTGFVEASGPEEEIASPVAGARAALESLPYLGGSPDAHAERSGVFEHRPKRTSPGWNLFSSRLRPRAFLLDMEGAVGHEWQARSGPWQHVELLPGGDLLALVKDERLLRLDARSRLVWSRTGTFHHDLSVDGQGRIHVLDRSQEIRPEIHPEIPTTVDYITVLSPDGEPIDRISVLDLVLDSPYAFLLPDVHEQPIDPARTAIDILHTNHVEVFDGRLADRSPLYRAGNVLLSSRTLSTVLIADPERREILWAWGPSNLIYQHHPTLLDGGNILIFNNGLERSEVVELDPLARKVVWRFRHDELFSRLRGSCQRLPNGNTLITESDTGYVFEVTPDGERVWRFANPFFTEEGHREAIWRMIRIPDGDPRLPPGLGPALDRATDRAPDRPGG
ncbi:MAG: arylsulfotransferase family protein [Acidobacteriota bacterium]